MLGAIGIADEHEDFGWEEDGIDPKFEEFPGFRRLKYQALPPLKF
jgi:hypothetical protein